MELFDKKIIFMTGKGGVGKSTLTGAFALKAAASNKRVLIIELGTESTLCSYFNIKQLCHYPKVITKNLSLLNLTAENSLREYFLHLFKVDLIFKLFFENKVMRTFLNVAPALKEIAILGKITSGLRKVGSPMPYDLIIVDSFSTGHTLALLRAPKGIQEIMKVGPLMRQCEDINHILQNPQMVGCVVTTLPEELPITESLELLNTLKKEFHIQPSLIINKMISEDHITDNIDNLKKASVNNPFFDFLYHKYKKQKQFIDLLKKETVPIYFSDLNLQESLSPHFLSQIGESIRVR